MSVDYIPRNKKIEEINENISGRMAMNALWKIIHSESNDPEDNYWPYSMKAADCRSTAKLLRNMSDEQKKEFDDYTDAHNIFHPEFHYQEFIDEWISFLENCSGYRSL